MAFYAYIIHSPAISKFYIGSTSNLEKRIYYHNNRKSPYTKNKGPWFVVYQEAFKAMQNALRRGRELKKWNSSKRIIDEFGIDLNVFGNTD